MINITKFDIVTLCATLSEENNVFENNIYLHFVYTIEVFLKQLVTGHPVDTKYEINFKSFIRTKTCLLR